MTAAPTRTRPAGLTERLLARIIDGLLLALVDGVVVTGTVVTAILGHGGSAPWSAPTGYLDTALAAVLGAAVNLGYFGYLESTSGRTVGKVVMRLRVLSPDGGDPTPEEAVRRNCWTALGALAVVPVVGSALGGLATLVAVLLIARGIARDEAGRQGWHDRFAGGTHVVAES